MVEGNDHEIDSLCIVLFKWCYRLVKSFFLLFRLQIKHISYTEARSQANAIAGYNNPAISSESINSFSPHPSIYASSRSSSGCGVILLSRVNLSIPLSLTIYLIDVSQCAHQETHQTLPLLVLRLELQLRS